MPDPANEPPRNPLAVYPMDQAAGRKTTATKAGLAAAVAMVLGGIYAVEGGYVNHPADPGGATNYGITERTARAAGYRGDMRYFPKHCEGPEGVCADGIYTAGYLAPFMPVIVLEPAIGEKLANIGVNTGPGKWPARWFKRSLNEVGGFALAPANRITADDLNAYRQIQARMGKVPACYAVLDRLIAKQSAFYRGIVQRRPSKKVFLRGWLARAATVRRDWCGRGL